MKRGTPICQRYIRKPLYYLLVTAGAAFCDGGRHQPAGQQPDDHQPGDGHDVERRDRYDEEQRDGYGEKRYDGHSVERATATMRSSVTGTSKSGMTGTVSSAATATKTRQRDRHDENQRDRKRGKRRNGQTEMTLSPYAEELARILKFDRQVLIMVKEETSSTSSG